MKIRELIVGSNATITLLVKGAEIKLTKSLKPYLSTELFDGMDSIQAVDWDYGDKEPPAKNSILNVHGQVTEWAGNKQLKINFMSINTQLGIEEFAPKGDVDVNDYVERAKNLMAEIVNPHCQAITQRAFKENSALWKTIPSAKGIHHAFVAGNLKHSVDVAIKAKAMAEVMPWVNKDLCIAGGLLQDFGKLWTYQLNGAVIDMTNQGMMLEHIAIGIARLETYRTPENSTVLDLVQHIVSSHHSKLEYGSPTTPVFLEAWIVAACDMLDSRAQIIYELNAKAKPTDVLTEKSYALENRQMFTQFFIDEVMG